MIDKTTKPLRTKIEEIKISKALVTDDGTLVTCRIKLSIPVDEDAFMLVLNADEVAAAKSLLKSAARSQADDEPHTYKVAVKRGFEPSEFNFSRGEKEGTINVVTDTKNTPVFKIVGDEAGLHLTVEGNLKKDDVAEFATWAGGFTTLVVNELQNVLSLDKVA